VRRVLVWNLLLIACVVAAACGGRVASPHTTPPVTSRYAGGAIVSPRLAPPLALTNYNGVPVNLTQFRGKAVLVTFVYTHCTNVCPIIVSSLAIVQARLGSAASRLAIVAVTTDPTGDTPRSVATFLSARGMTGKMYYLLGNPASVRIAWFDWQVAVGPDQQVPTLVDHTAAVFGVSATGKVVTIYPANFRPSAIVHDVPILEGE
jgi:protein SCO1/2